MAREEWWAYVGLDTSAFEEGLDELQALGQAVVSVFRNLDSLRLGNPDQFQAQGRQAALAYIQGMRQGLGGASLQQFIGQQLSIPPSALRALESDLSSIERRIRAIGMGGSASRPFGTEQLGSMRALEDQANRSARAVSEANAQLILMRQQLAQMAGLSIPRSVFRREGEAVQLTPAARRIVDATGANITLQALPGGRINQSAARSELAAALQSTTAGLESRILSASGYTRALPSAPTPSWTQATEREQARIIAREERMIERIDRVIARAEAQSNARRHDTLLSRNPLHATPGYGFDLQGNLEVRQPVFQTDPPVVVPPGELPSWAELKRRTRDRNEEVIYKWETDINSDPGIAVSYIPPTRRGGRWGPNEIDLHKYHLGALRNGNSIPGTIWNNGTPELRHLIFGSSEKRPAGDRFRVPGTITIFDLINEIQNGQQELEMEARRSLGQNPVIPIPLQSGEQYRAQMAAQRAEQIALARTLQQMGAPIAPALAAGPGISGDDGRLYQAPDGTWYGREQWFASQRVVPPTAPRRGPSLGPSPQVIEGEVLSDRPYTPRRAIAAVAEEERLAQARERAQRATAGAAANEERLSNERAGGAGRGGGGGGRRGGGGSGVAGGDDEEESYFQKWVREGRSRGFFGPDESGMQFLSDEAQARRTTQGAAREQARGGIRDPYDYDAAYEQAEFQERMAEQSYRRRRAREEARRDVYGEFDEDEFGMTERDRLNEQRRRENLRDYMRSDAPFLSRVGALFTGRAPGDDTPGMSMGAQFMSGFMGNAAQPVMAQLGQTAKFSLFYGAMYSALFQLSQGFQWAIQGVLEFENALADLNIITDQSRAQNEEWADSLGELGTSVGFTAGQGVQAGARAIGLYGVAAEAEPVQRSVADLSTEVAGRIAFLSGEQDIEKTQVQVAGLMRAFDSGPYDQRRLEDELAYLYTKTGQSQKDMLEGAVQIANLAADAGYTRTEVLAMISQIAKTTARTPTAVAGSLPQVFSKLDEPGLQAELRKLGVDTEGTSMAEQLRQLGQRREAGLIPDEQYNQIINAFGRGQSNNSIDIIVKEWEKIAGLSEGALNAPEGLGEEQFKKAVASIGRQLQLLAGEVKELLVDVAGSGMFDVVALLVSGIRAVVGAADGLVDLFNSLPRVLRTTAFALGELYLVAKIFGNTRLGVGAAGMVNWVASAGGRTGFQPIKSVGRGEGATILPVPGLGGSRGVGPVGREAIEPPSSSQARSRQSLGDLARSAGPIAALFAGLSVAQQIDETVDQRELLREGMRAAGSAITPAEMRDAAGMQDEFIRRAEDSQGGLIGQLRKLPWVSTARWIDQAEESQTDLQRLAKDLELAQERSNVTAPETSFGSFASVDAVSEGLAELSDRGYSAAQQLDLLNNAFVSLIRNAGPAAGNVATLFQGQGEEFGIRVGGAANQARSQYIESLMATSAELDPYGADVVQRGFWDKLSGVVTDPLSGDFWKGFTPEAARGRDQRRAAEVLEGADLSDVNDTVRDRVLQVLENRGLNPEAGPVFLTDEDVRVIEEEAANALASSVEGWENVPAEIQEGLARAFAESYRDTLNDFGGRPMDATTMRGYIEAVLPLAQSAGQTAGVMAGGDSVAAAEGARDYLAEAYANAQAALDEADPAEQEAMARMMQTLEVALAQAELEVSASLSARAQGLAQLAASRLPMDDQVGRLGAEIDGIREALSLATPDQRPGLQAQLNERLAAQETARRQAAAANALADVSPQDRQGRLQVQISNAQTELASLTPGTQQYGQVRDQLSQLLQQAEDYGLALAESSALLGIPVGDRLGRLEIAVGTAEQSLAAAQASGADADTVFRRLQAIREAQYAYAQGSDAQAAAVATSRLDPRDTMGGIRAELVAAQRALGTANRYGDTQGAAEATRRIRELRVQGMQETLALWEAEDRALVTPGDERGDAAVAVSAARNRLRNTLPGTREFFEAQRGLAEAQQAYADLARDYGAKLRTLASDITDPVVQARNATLEAMDLLNAADTDDERTDASLQLKQAQANEERTAFDQRLRDVQINEQLGRMSHQAYIRFLQSERENLLAMGVNTRQRVDMLNEIDLALKAATDQMSGQWNLGDIRVPSVYEMRQVAGGAAIGGSAASVTNVQVSINGADLGQVKSFLTTLLGPSAVQRTATGTRRY